MCVCLQSYQAHLCKLTSGKSFVSFSVWYSNSIDGLDLKNKGCDRKQPNKTKVILHKLFISLYESYVQATRMSTSVTYKGGLGGTFKRRVGFICYLYHLGNWKIKPI